MLFLFSMVLSLWDSRLNYPCCRIPESDIRNDRGEPGKAAEILSGWAVSAAGLHYSKTGRLQLPIIVTVPRRNLRISYSVFSRCWTGKPNPVVCRGSGWHKILSILFLYYFSLKFIFFWYKTSIVLRFFYLKIFFDYRIV